MIFSENRYPLFGIMLLALRAQRGQIGLQDDAKRCRAILLPQQRELRDRERLPGAVDGVEAPLQQGADRVAAFAHDWAGQGHMKATLLEHERIAPTLDILGLAGSQ